MALQQSTFRPLAHFPPNIWGDHFASFPSDKLVIMEEYAKEVELLKEEVRAMLLDCDTALAEKMCLINSVHRLGVSYHFEKEIEDLLDHIFQLHSSIDDNQYDLYTISLQFRVFRQHGYNMSCDVFKKFKESNGEFKKTLASDQRGMLSLYEATHLRLRGEDILDEALAFTTAHLETMKAPHLSPPLSKQVNHALIRPFHKGMPRLEARHYISVYEEDESRSELLLKLAKFDFNLVQLFHQQELSHIVRWWKNLKFSSKLSYARDRVVECFFWIVGVYFEPHYSIARTILTKIIVMSSVIDDTYDAYGTLEELQLFTDSVERWDVSAIDQLPDYMKVCYTVLLHLYDEFDEQMRKEGRSYSVYHAKEAMKELVRSYYVEAKWYNSGYVPPFEEYMVNALITCGYHMLTTSSFVGMGEIASKEAFDWLQSRPKIVTASETICRLMDDIVSHQAEQERGHVASAIECYMKQYGVVCEKEVIDEFQTRISNAWKDVSEECLLRPAAISMHLLTRVVNFARMMDVIYKYEDGYTNLGHELKDFITSLFINSIPF